MPAGAMADRKADRTGDGYVEPLLEQLFRLRLVVARHGEMDRARWWNANGVLGTRGETVLRRGFPRTAPLGRARVAFTVAHARCAEAVGLNAWCEIEGITNPPGPRTPRAAG